jgi:hypothetical protein
MTQQEYIAQIEQFRRCTAAMAAEYSGPNKDVVDEKLTNLQAALTEARMAVSATSDVSFMRRHRNG